MRALFPMATRCILLVQTDGYMNNIIRVGDDYFKFVDVMSADQRRVTKMFGIRRQTITDDFGREFLRSIPKYDAFVNVPDNYGSTEIPKNLYNLYTALDHQPRKGEWKWTKIMMNHIFGDQYELGLDYVQLLMDKPLQILPVLSLVSKENQTGKTTFVNWLQMLFKENMVIIGNQELVSSFNFVYGSKLIIAIEESRIERSNAQEKLKALATQKKIVLNDKFQRPHVIDYFGKLILVSNHEDNFISANKQDIRYWVRKVPTIPEQNKNYDFEQALEEEIPAFLYMLRGRKLSTDKQSRAWFATDLIETDALNSVREHSHTPLYFDLKESLVEFFSKRPQKNELNATAKMLIENLLPKNNQYNSKYLAKVIKDEFELQNRFGRFDETEFGWVGNPGHYYTFKRSDILEDIEEFETKNTTNYIEKLPF